ncbi:MAG: hypothetical protein ATN35_11700 [Epulopiscium sp. Nele67-Bin004]|nr:MAG: hypothetical protein ATN35_11700 [Epulopiscium sp. Nele67-Bin004]
MRIRGKFTKEGRVKFVGHLDTVRLFQRAIKVAKINVAYSEGFNPHSKVYFAMPLSVGVSSVGEYIEIRTKDDMDVADMKERLNNILPEGIKMLDTFEVVEGTPTLMSQVDVADYVVDIDYENKAQLLQVLQQDEILISKRNKKKKWVEVDIKPLIIDCEIVETENKLQIIAKLFAGSKQNLNVDLLLKALFKEEFDNLIYTVTRTELYTDQDGKYIPILVSDRV